jgi:hypothetical protein
MAGPLLSTNVPVPPPCGRGQFQAPPAFSFSRHNQRPTVEGRLTAQEALTLTFNLDCCPWTLVE